METASLTWLSTTKHTWELSLPMTAMYGSNFVPSETTAFTSVQYGAVPDNDRELVFWRLLSV